MSRGFTLIEIVMVTLLIAILAAVVIPRLGMFTGMQLEVAAKKVASDIRYAQSAAMTNRTSHWVRITFREDPNNSYSIYSETVNIKNPVTQESSFFVQLNQGEYQGIKIFNTFSTTFYYPLGSPTAGGYVRLKRDAAFKNISIIPVTGKVAVH